MRAEVPSSISILVSPDSLPAACAMTGRRAPDPDRVSLDPAPARGKRETSVSQHPDTRSALAIGWDWGTRITAIGLEFALPVLVGFGLDRWWNTIPWLTVLGAFLGLAVGMVHVFRLAGQLPGNPPAGRGRRGGRDPRHHDGGHA
jgi:hypothetical protein